jgi:transposase-like protein
MNTDRKPHTRQSREFKLSIMRLHVRERKSIQWLSDTYQIPVVTLYGWHKEYSEYGENSFVGSGKCREPEAKRPVNYSRAFKRSAACLVAQGGVSIATLSGVLGVSREALNNWCNQYNEFGDMDVLPRGNCRPKAVDLHRLEKENAQLRRENAELKIRLYPSKEAVG